MSVEELSITVRLQATAETKVLFDSEHDSSPFARLVAACVTTISSEQLLDEAVTALQNETDAIMGTALTLAEMEIDWVAFDKEHEINGQGVINEH